MADPDVGASRGSSTLRRVIPVLAMFGGAFLGALAVKHIGLALPLAAAAALTATSALLAMRLSRGIPPGRSGPSRRFANGTVR